MRKFPQMIVKLSSLYRAKIIYLAIIYLFLTAIFISQTRSQDIPAMAPIDGYWEITAQFADFDINSIIRFKTASDKRTVEGIALGPAGGRDATFRGEISGNQLLLNTLGPNGQMRVKLTLSGNDLSGMWLANGKEGKISGERIKSKENDSGYYAKYFKIFYESLKSNFYDPNFNGVDIEKLGEKYASRLSQVKDDADFVQLMRQMAAEFKVSHTDFYLNPQTVPIKQKTPVISWEKLSDQTGYLRLRSFEAITLRDEANYYQSLEKAFSELSRLPNLVIDLRGNSGGDMQILYKTLSYFISNGEEIGYAFSRTGLSKVALLKSKDTNPSAQFPVVQTHASINSEIFKNGAAIIKINSSQKNSYQGKTALLIGGNCYSACEIFAAVLQENRNATVIGRRSGGEVLVSYTDTIFKNMIFVKKDTGWRMQIPIIDFYTMSGKRIEGSGVIPDIEISEKNTNGELQEAVRYLQSNL